MKKINIRNAAAVAAAFLFVMGSAGFAALTPSLTALAAQTPVYAEDGSRDYEAEMEARRQEPAESNADPDWPQGPAVGAEGAILMEADTGTILYAKNIHEQLYPASTTKILTCLIAAEQLDLNDTVTFSHDAVFSVPQDGSSVGIDEGESLTVEECLYAILVGSANEVSNAVAEKISGSVEAFAVLMNERAAQLGCTDSHFTNANGLFEEEHYTSAHDLALIARAFFANETLLRIGNTPTYHFTPTETQPDDFWIRNGHSLINGTIACEGIIGGKTGYTGESRRVLVTGCERDGMRLICVVMREEAPEQFNDTVSLFEYGYSNFKKVSASDYETRYTMRAGDFLDSGSDIFGDSTPIFSISGDSTLILPNNASFSDLTTQISDSSDDSASLARLTYSYHDVPVGQADLYMVQSAVSSEPSASANPQNAENAAASGSGAEAGSLSERAASLFSGAFHAVRRTAASFLTVTDRTRSGVLCLNVRNILILVVGVAAILIAVIMSRAISDAYYHTRSEDKKRRRRRRRSRSVNLGRYQNDL
ncbi:MAG: D-alanyl-D-alanine carboxypeptidase family protein [Eubacteriales bacterium]|nr:D-alanyl-D-alanine carboxypeptidase family protein [Eubacteriales bacterium]